MGQSHQKMYDHWSDKEFQTGYDNEYLIMEPYGFYLLSLCNVGLR